MHILHVFDHSLPLHSGYSFRSRAILREQHRLGWRTSHLTSPKHALAAPRQTSTLAQEETIDGLLFHRTAPLAGPAARLPLLRQQAIMTALRRRLLDLAKRLRPDLIHAHSPALNGLPAVAVGRRLRIPVVYEVRAFWEDAAVSHGTSRAEGLRYRLSRQLETRVLRQADAVACICAGLRGDIRRRGIPDARIVIIPNAVDVEHFAPIAGRDPALAAQLGLTEAPVIGFIGSFYAYEGLDLLLEAVARLGSGPRLLLVGGGPMESALKARAAALGIGAGVHFIGRIPQKQVPRYYSLIDVLAYPRRSLPITELVTPLKPLEAMAQGSIFVASDVGGHRELIRDGETGTLFRKDDVASLARALAQTLGERERWPARRQAARRFVEQERTWAHSVAGYAPVYEGLCRRRG